MVYNPVTHDFRTVDNEYTDGDIIKRFDNQSAMVGYTTKSRACSLGKGANHNRVVEKIKEDLKL